MLYFNHGMVGDNVPNTHFMAEVIFFCNDIPNIGCGD